MIPLNYFPALDAGLNAASAVFLACGYIFIRRKKIVAHKTCMLSAVGSSALFLICYLWYHAHHGLTRFQSRGLVRVAYLAILGSHTILAVVIVPLVLATLFRALQKRFDLHKRVARLTLPPWLYVSLTGVVVYWMLYHLDAR